MAIIQICQHCIYEKEREEETHSNGQKEYRKSLLDDIRLYGGVDPWMFYFYSVNVGNKDKKFTIVESLTLTGNHVHSARADAVTIGS